MKTFAVGFVTVVIAPLVGAVVIYASIAMLFVINALLGG